MIALDKHAGRLCPNVLHDTFFLMYASNEWLYSLRGKKKKKLGFKHTNG